MKELLVQASGDLLMAMMPLLLAAVSWAVKKLGDKFAADSKSRLTGMALEKVATVAEIVVKELSATLVAEYKKAAADGKLTAEEKAQIKQIAVDKLKSYLSLDELTRVVAAKSIDTFLGSVVESEVSNQKKY